MEKLIAELGDNFRGVWRARHFTNREDGKWVWYVTFVFKNDLVETDGDSTAEVALKTAIYILTHQQK